MVFHLGELVYISQRQLGLRTAVFSACLVGVGATQAIYTPIRDSTSSYTLAVSALLDKRVRGRILVFDRLIEVRRVAAIDRAHR